MKIDPLFMGKIKLDLGWKFGSQQPGEIMNINIPDKIMKLVKVTRIDLRQWHGVYITIVLFILLKDFAFIVYKFRKLLLYFSFFFYTLNEGTL